MIDPSSLDEPIQQLLRKVGTYILREFQHFDFSRVSYKGEKNPFTDVDVSADNMLRGACSQLIPGSDFINEELGETATDATYRWIIDPIDGTVNFMHGIPHFCISLALQKEGETIMGYIYQPVSDEMFHAKIGEGAFLNGNPLSVSTRPELQTAVVSTGFPYGTPAWKRDFLGMVMHVASQIQGLRRMGSAALDLAYVAAGRLDGFFEYKLNAWDVAAGGLIVKEAGGVVSDFSGEDNYIFSGELVASNPKIHTALLDALAGK
ncbi:MAG: inositol monophosphatase family protein [Bacteroidota bacterium]